MRSPRSSDYEEVVQSLRQQLEAARRELAKQETQLETFLNSPSWRMTSPLRWLVRQFRSLRVWFKQGTPAATKTEALADRAAEPEISQTDFPVGTEDLFTKYDAIPLSVLLSSAVMLRMPRSEAPELSVILIVSTGAARTLACLRSLQASSPNGLEVIILDNASTDETAALLERVEGAQIIRCQSAQSFPVAANQAGLHARGRYLLFLSTDVELLQGSLASAVKELQGSTNIGAVCGRVVRFDGLLEEAGRIKWSDGTIQPYGKDDYASAPMYMFRRDVDASSAAFLLTPRATWVSLKGFDETFAAAHCAEDYCARLWKHRLRIVYDPNAVVFGCRPAFIAEQYSSSAGSILEARMRNRSKRLLFLEDRVPHTWLGSGFPRARTVLLSMLKQGYFVTFYPLFIADEDWPSVYSDMPKDVEFMTGWGRLALEGFLRSRRAYYDTIFVSRPHNLAMLQPLVQENPDFFENVNIIYDAEALFAAREIARRNIVGPPLSEEQSRQLIHDEVALTRSADTVVTVSEQECETFRNHGIESVHVLGHALVCDPTPRAFEERAGFLFVGAVHDEFSPNRDAILWFLSEIFPRIRAELGSNATVTIVGVNNSKTIRQAQDPGVKIIGFLADLLELYDSARVFVAPTRFAAGIPHKVHQAAAYGLPVVATPLLANQLGWRDRSPIAVGSDAASFAKKCIELYTDKELWTHLRLAALERVQTECSPERFESDLAKILAAGD